MDCKRSSSPESADIIGGNNDLLMEIFLFLPVKSLIRFQSVSKQWRYLILDPRFSLLHTLHHRRRCKPPPSFLLRSSITSHFFVFHPIVKKLVPLRFEFTYLKILQSCNGLLLLECRSSPYGKKDYVICNPATGKHRKLVLQDERGERVRGLCIVFDPAKSPYYKVFCFRGNGNQYSRLVEAYDSETHSWTERIKIHGRPHQIINGVYWNDALYFIRPRGSSCYFSFEDDFYGFNCIRKPPRDSSSGAKKRHVMESNGHLHFVVLSLRPDKNYVCVFEGTEDNCSCWHMKYRADLDPVSATFGGNLNAISLLGMIRGKSERDSALLFHVPGKIMAYKFIENNFEVLIDFTTEHYFEQGQLQFLFKDVHQFIHTLAPV